MSKRKPIKASKRARTPAIATRAHGNKQAVVRSAKDNLLRSVAAGLIESPLELHSDPKQEAPNVDKQVAPIPKPVQEAAIAAKPVMQDGPGQMLGFDFASVTRNMVAYQLKLVEMTQANMRFAFELSQKLLTIRSPFQFVDFIGESIKRRADMVGKQSTELAALTRR
ncbi:Phasin protein (plasmid) [Bradyrhizobium sp. PMVTL-01]|uniref:Phasin protein n=1 Tax=Bradyrhizobium sp. PMVTL-01 TaxID=3434999 RepID=UPI003F708AF2